MFNRSAIKFLFTLIKLKPIYIVVSLFFSLSATVLNLLATILLIPVFYTLLRQQEQLFLSVKFNYLDILISWLNLYQAELQLLIMLSCLLLIIIFKNIIDYGNSIINFYHAQRLSTHLKIKGIDLLSSLDVDYYHKNKVTDIFSKLNRETERAVLAVKGIQKLLVIFIIMLMLIAILLIISWQLTLISLSLTTLLIWLNFWLTSQVKRRKYLALENLQTYNFHLVEFLSGIKLIKTVANEFAAVQKITSSLHQKSQSQLSTQLIAASIKPITEIGFTLLTLVIISYCILIPSVVEITSFLWIYLAVLWRLLTFISQFNSARLQYLNAYSSVGIVASFLSESNKSIAHSGKINFSKLQTGIKFEAVTFAYPQHARIILDKICLIIPPGKTTALVSFSKVERSIIADLLIRLYEPIEGKILWDDKELAKYDLPSLRKAIAIVSHNPFLFNDSLAYNISYGINNVSQEDLINAAKKAQIYQFIKSLPAGFATQVGRGVILSDEQKQGISIARAFLRNPEIVIIHEPIIAHDNNVTSPGSLSFVLNSLCRGKTAVIMTKQLNLVRQADQIMVFHQGRIKERGTHEQLLQSGTIYQRLYSRQFKTNQQSRRLKLAQKIAQKLAQQNHHSLSPDIRSHFNSLINHLEVINAGLFDQQAPDLPLDQSYQSAKDLLSNLREYKRLINRDLNNDNH
ncbi:MAG: ABC transporter ATP-binding protein [Cyanobacteria bacterium P01_G01_bin.39]